MTRGLPVFLCGLVVGMSVLGEAPSGDRTPEGYRIPTRNPEFSFPADHGSHPEFRIEWWYITGHLAHGENRRFGFQATFFRVALHPPPHPPSGSAFGTNQLFMAHMALSDLPNERFLHEERLNRDGWDAHARVGDLDLRNGNWTLRRIEGETMELAGSVKADAAFRLRLVPVKEKVVFGEEGLSKKGAERSAASWYITFPRLAVEGDLEVAGERLAVTGEAWMDHEISSSQLGREQVGWDWVSVRLHDGREIMVYILRTEDGTPDPFSTLAWIDREGGVTHLGPDGFTWTARDTWTSEATGAVYPLDVDLATTDSETGLPWTVRLRPLMMEQEMVGRLGGVSYWEGACEALDAGGRVIGEAYMELTGYAEDLGDALR